MKQWCVTYESGSRVIGVMRRFRWKWQARLWQSVFGKYGTHVRDYTWASDKIMAEYQGQWQ